MRKLKQDRMNKWLRYISVFLTTVMFTGMALGYIIGDRISFRSPIFILLLIVGIFLFSFKKTGDTPVKTSKKIFSRLGYFLFILSVIGTTIDIFIIFRDTRSIRGSTNVETVIRYVSGDIGRTYLETTEKDSQISEKYDSNIYKGYLVNKGSFDHIIYMESDFEILDLEETTETTENSK